MYIKMLIAVIIGVIISYTVNNCSKSFENNKNKQTEESSGISTVKIAKIPQISNKESPAVISANDELQQLISDKNNALNQQIEQDFNSSFDFDNKNKTLEIYSAGNAILENIEEYKISGIINPEITQTFLNVYSISTVSYIAIYATSYVLKDVYSIYNDLDKLAVKVYLLWNDKYGIPQKHLICKFNFDKQLHEKINWNSFHPKDLETISKNFQYSAWYQANI